MPACTKRNITLNRQAMRAHLRFHAPGHRAIRLASGLVLFTYVGLHLCNHSLGNISLAWMERGLLVQKFIWQGVLGTVALYTALATHFVLGLAAFYQRRRVHWTPGELAQLLLGLAIPPLLANHLAVTRIAFATYGLNKGYAQELYSFWIASPPLGDIQITLLIVAWLHGCLGITFWLRLKPWFAHVRAPLLSVAVLLPVLALLGYLQAGRQVVALAHDPAWRAAATTAEHVGTAAENVWLADLRNGFLVFDATAIGLVLLARGLRTLRERRGGRVRVLYPSGRRQFIPRGFTVLEASLLAGEPHAGLCGGRARCSLCRIRVLGGTGLPAVEEAERRILARLGADPAQIRLACQLRPTADIAVLPLVPKDAQTAFLHDRQRRLVAEERFLALMFIDMRGSTELAAARLPFDNVFVLGRFVAAVSAAVIGAGGLPNQFLGDGVLALFGLDTDETTACRRAMRALAAVAANIGTLGTVLRPELASPIQFGVGLHCGRAIVGEIGFREHTTFTALGDATNVAARLEGLSKELGCEAVVSEDVLRLAGVSAMALPLHEAQLRGRAEPVRVRLFRHVADDLTALTLEPRTVDHALA
jgi:adenylate cyclase